MGVVRSAHDVLAWVVMVSAGLVGAWTAGAHWVEGLRHQQIWNANHVVHFVIAVQVAFGAILVGFTNVEPSQNHMFYGFLTFVGVGLILGYRHLSEYRYLLYGLGGLFVMGLAIRAFLFMPLVS